MVLLQVVSYYRFLHRESGSKTCTILVGVVACGRGGLDMHRFRGKCSSTKLGHPQSHPPAA